MPIAAHKTEGPTKCLVFLGIEIDTIGKPERLQSILRQWGDRRVCTRKELESLVGLLNHACKVVRAGRSFLRRMIDLLHSRPSSSRCRGCSPIRLNAADLAWWVVAVLCIALEWHLISPYFPTTSSTPGDL